MEEEQKRSIDNVNEWMKAAHLIGRDEGEADTVGDHEPDLEACKPAPPIACQEKHDVDHKCCFCNKPHHRLQIFCHYACIVRTDTVVVLAVFTW